MLKDTLHSLAPQAMADNHSTTKGTYASHVVKGDATAYCSHHAADKIASCTTATEQCVAVAAYP